MEAHIKGHANEIPDDETEGNDAESTGVDASKQEMDIAPMPVTATPTETEVASSTTSMRSNLTSSSPINNVAAAIPHTPRESSSSEANSDGDEMNYYNLYSRFEQSIADNNYGHQSNGVNPALLAAVSIAANASANEEISQRNNILPHTMVSLPPPPAQPISNALLAAVNQQDSAMENSFIYEPLAVMRQQGYFTPAPKVEEFR